LAPTQYKGIYHGYSGQRFVLYIKDSEGFNFGVLDGNGHEKVPFEYSYIEPFQNFAYDLVKVNIKKKQLIFRITATK